MDRNMSDVTEEQVKELNTHILASQQVVDALIQTITNLAAPPLEVSISIQDHGTLKKWLIKNWQAPFPSESELNLLSQSTKMTINQLLSWFRLVRITIWRPLVNMNTISDTTTQSDKQTGEQIDRNNLKERISNSLSSGEATTPVSNTHIKPTSPTYYFNHNYHIIPIVKDDISRPRGYEAYHGIYNQHTSEHSITLSDTVRPSLREDIEQLKEENKTLKREIQGQFTEYQRIYREASTRYSELLQKVERIEQDQKRILEDNRLISQQLLSSSKQQSILIESQGSNHCSFRPSGSVFEPYRKVRVHVSSSQQLRMSIPINFRSYQSETKTPEKTTKKREKRNSDLKDSDSENSPAKKRIKTS